MSEKCVRCGKFHNFGCAYCSTECCHEDIISSAEWAGVEYETAVQEVLELCGVCAS